MTKQSVELAEAVVTNVTGVTGSSSMFPCLTLWVEAMKASSPTHPKAAVPLSIVDETSTWMMNHPSALEKFCEIANASVGRKIFMFMDYDGTLSPIVVEDPDRAFMSDSMRDAVRGVAEYFPTAIVSPRCLHKVYSFVRLAELASEILQMIDERWNALAEQVMPALKGYPKLKVTQGRKVLEIRPTIKWALEFLLESLGFANSNDVLPVYIGDDRTDEGLGILVSKFPKETNASYSLQEPSEVMDFLQRMREWKEMALKGRLPNGGNTKGFRG